ncbi:MAG: glycosyltransferase family 4 protein, partial [Candidatus Promineifilaceae bacterium]
MSRCGNGCVVLPGSKTASIRPKSTVRILIISNYFPPFEIGGWEQLTADVAAMLEKRGHTLWVMTGSYRAEEMETAEPRTERVLYLESPDHIHYHPQYTLLHRRWLGKNKQLLGRRVAAFSPDIIFINGMWNLSPALAKEAERLCPGRVVYYMASPWPVESDAHSTYWSLPAAKPSLKWPKEAVGKVIQRLWLSPTTKDTPAFQHVLCVSDYMRRFIVEQAGIPANQTRVVYNGIDPAVFSPNPSQNGRKSLLRLLYAGQLRDDKGVHTAVEAVGHAAQS